MSRVGIGDAMIRNTKRKRVNGNNPSKRSEMKQYNPFFSSITSSVVYDAIRISNVYLPSNIPADSANYTFGSWYPIPIRKPGASNPSAGVSGMIGKEIFLRYLRFKGYIELLKYPQYKIHYRLRLIRSHSIVFNSLVDYLSVFKNKETAFNSVDTKFNSCRHNFFKMVRNVDTKINVKITTIASGVLPSFPGTENAVLEVGNQSAYGYVNVKPVEVFGGNECLPLDVKVTCNDRWGSDVFYYLILETDYANAFIYNDIARSNNDCVTRSDAFGQSPVLFNFFCTGYYTDD